MFHVKPFTFLLLFWCRRLSDPFTIMLLREIFQFQCPLSTIYSNHTMDIQCGNYTRSVLQVYIYKKGTHGVIGLLFSPIQPWQKWPRHLVALSSLHWLKTYSAKQTLNVEFTGHRSVTVTRSAVKYYSVSIFRLTVCGKKSRNLSYINCHRP